jgi:hypothetical protein
MATWEAADPRWAWEREVRMGFLPEIEQETLQRLGEGLATVNRFDELDKVAGELRAGGLEPDRVEPHAIDFVYPDEQAWWDWNWSHGSRVFLEALSEDAQERFRVRAFEAMQAVREGEGFPRRYTAIFAAAQPAV